MGDALAEHLADLARTHNGRRAHLPVGTSAQSLAALLVDRDYPEQGTSWIALYHILQRYGGFDGLSRTTRVFDADGRFVPGPWDALEARLKAAREREEKRSGSESKRKADADYRSGNRVLADLLGGLIGGSVIGYGVDTLAGTWPWGLLVGLFAGIGVAFRNIFRMIRRWALFGWNFWAVSFSTRCGL